MPAVRRGSSRAAATIACALAAAGATGGGCVVRKSAAVPTAGEAIHYPLRTLELADGLTVVLEQAPDFGSAGAMLVVGAGSADEPADKAGLAHLVEHLAFDATHRGVSFFDWSRNLDGGVNAFTTWDDTSYVAFERTPALPRMLAFLAGVVTDPLAGVDERTFAKELHAVSNERRMRTEEGTPGQAEGWLMAATFPADHPYAHSPGGTAESLARLSLADVRAFASSYYKPQGSTLVVSAPFALDDLQRLVEQVTGQAAHVREAGAARARAVPVPASAPASFDTRDADVPTPTLWIGWSVPASSGAKGDLAPLVAAIARSSAWSDLGERDPDVAYLRADYEAGSAADLFFVEVALTRAAHPRDTARLVVDEVQGSLGDLTARGVAVEELTRFTATDFVYDEESLPARTRSMAWSEQHVGAATYLRDRGARLGALAAADVTDYVRAFLGADRAHALLVRPGAAHEPAGGPGAMVAAGATPPSAASAAPAAESDAPLPALAGFMPPRPERPALAGLETRTLDNGLHVVVLPRAGSPFHTVLLGFAGGRGHAQPPGVLTALAWAKHSPERSPRIFGIDYRAWVTSTGTGEALRATGSDVRKTLGHLRRMLGFSVFWPPREFNKRVEVLEREDRAPAAALDRRLARAVYGATPMGAAPTAKEIQRITPGEVNRWVARVRRPANALLVVVGDVDLDETMRAARDVLGDWGANAAAAPPLDDPAAADALADPGGSGQVLVQDRPGAQQATIELVCVLPPTDADDVAARIVFADGVKRSLLLDLREHLAASYGVRGGISVAPGGTTILDLSADVDYGLLAPALRRVHGFLDGSVPLPSGAAFTATRRGTADRMRLEAGTTAHLAAELFETWSLHQPLESIDRRRDQALATEPAAVAAIAAHCRANWVLGLLGDEPRLRAAWSAAAAR
jgi:zinc protease